MDFEPFSAFSPGFRVAFGSVLGRPSQDRPIRLGYGSGSIALGLMLGPVLGAALSQQGFAAAVRVCAALSRSESAREMRDGHNRRST